MSKYCANVDSVTIDNCCSSVSTISTTSNIYPFGRSLGSQEIHLSDEYADKVYVDKIKMNLVPPIKDVRFNDPATIVFFEDGTKTVVKRMEDQAFDPELGFLLCIMKRVYGDDYHKLMWKHCWGGQEARRAHRKKYKMANKAKDETK